jgi:acetyltransferase-like isoleucine patch superfamily enzyme
MKFAGLGPIGRFASWLAALFMPPFHGRYHLRYLNPKGYIAHDVKIFHEEFSYGENVFIGNRTIIYQDVFTKGGPITLGKHVGLGDDVTLETGMGGSIFFGDDSRCQFRCHFAAYKERIEIGKNVGIAQGCSFFSHDHGNSAEKHFELISKGPIIVGDGAWIGKGATILSGVRIGKEAVIAADSVVTNDVPDGAVAAGVPARVIKLREELRGK